jgi:signal transduction histidine kinase
MRATTNTLPYALFHGQDLEPSWPRASRPLKAMLSINEMILGEPCRPLPADPKQPLGYIQSSGKHLLRPINNVLDRAKIEAGRRLRAHTATANTSIIAITSLALRGDDQKANEADATTYIAKPHSPFALLELIRRLLPEQ